MFWLGLSIGLVVGAHLGVFIICACVLAKDNREDE